MRKRILSLTTVVFFSAASILPSFAAVGTTSTPVFEGDGMFIPYEDDTIEGLVKNAESIVVSEDGVLSNPVIGTEDGSRIGSNDIVDYQVRRGDTIGGIAARYGILPSTVLAVNHLTDKSPIKPGQKIRIIPVDGILYTVGKDETIMAIAKKQNVDPLLIAEQNNLTLDETIAVGKELIIPGVISEVADRLVAANDAKDDAAAKKQQVTKKADPKNTTSTIAVSKKAPVVAVTKQGKSLVWPASSPVITQKFHGGHPGIDIAYVSGDHTTAIVAAAAGKVVQAQSGWNGGYGNMVVVDHGNGLRTRYAHLREIYVTTGQQVKAGQAVGWMGKTGHVYGRTGLHLHFEVISGTLRVNPLSYL